MENEFAYQASTLFKKLGAGDPKLSMNGNGSAILIADQGELSIISTITGKLTSYPKDRRYVWLKTTIRSLHQQQVGMQPGLNKEV